MTSTIPWNLALPEAAAATSTLTPNFVLKPLLPQTPGILRCLQLQIPPLSCLLILILPTATAENRSSRSFAFLATVSITSYHIFPRTYSMTYLASDLLLFSVLIPAPPPLPLLFSSPRKTATTELYHIYFACCVSLTLFLHPCSHLSTKKRIFITRYFSVSAVIFYTQTLWLSPL